MTDVKLREPRNLLLKSKVVGVFGDPDSGKTFLMEVFAWWMLKFGGTVLSNIPLVKYDPEAKEEIEARVPGYIACDSFSDMFVHISERLIKDPDARFLVLLDEAGARFGKASWAATLSIVLRSALTLVRKFGVVLMFAAVSEDILLKDLREDPALVHVKLFKGGYLLNKHAPDFLDEIQDPKHGVLIWWPAKGRFFDPFRVSSKDRLAVPVEEARKTGAVYFDTKGISDFSLGIHPVTGKVFNFDELLGAVKGIGAQVPARLWKYMHEPIELPTVGEKQILERLPEDETHTPRGDQQKEKAVKLFLDGQPRKVVETETGLSYRRISQIKRELKDAGRLA